MKLSRVEFVRTSLAPFAEEFKAAIAKMKDIGKKVKKPIPIIVPKENEDCEVAVTIAPDESYFPRGCGYIRLGLLPLSNEERSNPDEYILTLEALNDGKPCAFEAVTCGGMIRVVGPRSLFMDAELAKTIRSLGPIKRLKQFRAGVVVILTSTPSTGPNDRTRPIDIPVIILKE